MKRPATAMAERAACAKGKGQPKRRSSAKAVVARCVRDIVPPKRTAYALFIAENYGRIHDEVKAENLGKKRPQREAMRRISVEWHGLSDQEREVYYKKARAEAQTQATARDAIWSQKVEESEELPQPNVVGDWSLSKLLWSCGHSTAHIVTHKVFKMQAMATVFSDAKDFAAEVAVLSKLQADELIRDELFLVAREWTGDRHPVRCIIQEYLPTLEDYRNRSERIEGTRLAAIALQLCCALRQLQELGFLHLDVRAKAVHFDERTCSAKLARFHRARLAADCEEPLDYPPYIGSHRAPELWSVGRNSVYPVGELTESFAFGVVLVECGSAAELFSQAAEVIHFRVDDNRVLTKYPTLQMVAAPVRAVASRFLLPVDQRLSLSEFWEGKSHFYKQLSAV